MFASLWLVFLVNAFAVRCQNEAIDLISAAAEKSSRSTTSTTFRLPKDTKPIRYDLKITPELEGDFTFRGNVKITIKVISNTKKVYIHSRSLEIVEFKVIKNYVKLDATLRIVEDKDTIVLQMSEELVANEMYELYFSYKGTLNDDLYGFYRSRYTVNDKTKWTASTHFGATGARMVFPCYDEPDQRAIFGITVGHYAYQSSLSNMPLKKISEPDPADNNRVWDTFYDTPEMPTYLVSFVVSQFSYITNSDRSFSVYSRENVIDDAEYTLKEGQKLLKQMGSFVGIAYNLPKMDAVAVPSAFGCMENWGLTTFRERYILYNEKMSSTKSKEMVLSLVAREFSQQWFGNYVTPAQWDYLWLKEAFGNYFQYFLTHQVEPSWRMDQIFLIEILQNSLSFDGITVHRAMIYTVSTSQEIAGLFDGISYDKGASILRMLEHIVSTSSFQKALKLFLEAGYKSGGSVQPNDLWRAFEQQMTEEKRSLTQDLTVSKIMKGWTEQPGYPLVIVRRVKVGDKTDVEIMQTVYKSPRSSEKIGNNQWIVPITCTTNSSINFDLTEPTLWLLDDNKKILSEVVDSGEWILCNVRQTGYYRVKYDIENWHLLIEQLEQDYDRIHVLNRVQLIDDSFFLAFDGALPYSIPIKLILYLDKEKDVLPWYKGLITLRSLYQQFEETKISRKLKNFISRRLTRIYKYIGFEVKSDDDHLVKTFRSAMLSFACYLQVSDCVQTAASLYNKNIDDLNKIHPDIKSTVFCIALEKDEGENVWNKLWSLYKRSNVAHEQETILWALACTKNELLLKKLLFKLVDVNDYDIRREYIEIVYKSVFSTMNGIMAGLKVIEEILQDIGKYEKGQTVVLQILRNLKSIVKTEGQIKMLSKLINDAGRLEQKKFGSITDSMRDARNAAIAAQEYNQGRISAISEGIENSRASFAPFIGPTKTTFLIIGFSLYFISSKTVEGKTHFT